MSCDCEMKQCADNEIDSLVSELNQQGIDLIMIDPESELEQIKE